MAKSKKILIPNVEAQPGVQGNWRVERFTVTPDGASLYNMRARASRHVVPGEYTRLTHYRDVIMSDTPAEKRDHSAFVRAARGDVLITGLGLGMCVTAVLAKRSVKRVHVVELSEDVIALTAQPLLDRYGDRLTIEHADAMKRVPADGEVWDAVWHDIWPTIAESNVRDMKALRAKYERTLRDEKSFYGAWCERTCVALVNRPYVSMRSLPSFGW
jgi:hypothetical protein